MTQKGSGSLSKDELQLLPKVLHRYAEFHLAQAEAWRVNTSYGPVYIEMTREKPLPDILDDHYTLLDEP